MWFNRISLQGWVFPFCLGTSFGVALCLGAKTRKRLWNLAVAKPVKKRPRKILRRLEPDKQGNPLHKEPYQRDVYCEDALTWMQGLDQGFPAGSCIITGLPDIAELVPMVETVARYKSWLQEAVRSILQRLPEDGIAIFMAGDVCVAQGDLRKRCSQESGGCYWEWVDKGFLISEVATEFPRVRLLWHKIIHWDSIDTGNFGSCAKYAHFLCFSVRSESEPFGGPSAFPDISRKGLKTWAAGAGIRSVEHACRYAQVRGCSVVVDPFCGEGAVLAIANAFGLRAIGVDSCMKRVKVARKLDGEALLAQENADPRNTASQS